MIKPKQFAILALTTLASVVVAVVLYAVTNRWSAGKVEGAQLAPSLARQEKAITAIELLQGEKKLTLERSGDQWTVKERGGYPANAERIRALLTTIASAQLIEPKTAVKDRYKQLELEDPTQKDAKSRGLRVLDDKGKPIVDVVLGKSRYDAFGSGRGGIYVRRATENQTWLATGDPKGSVEFKDWVSTTLYEGEQAKVRKVTIEHPGEEPLVVEREGDKDAKDAKFKVSIAAPEGKKLKSGAVDQVPQGFNSIDFEDVRKAVPPAADDKPIVSKLELEGGATVTFRIRKDGDANWVAVTASGGEGDAKTKADALNARAQGWEFKVPKWKIDQIGKHTADLFEAAS